MDPFDFYSSREARRSQCYRENERKETSRHELNSLLKTFGDPRSYICMAATERVVPLFWETY